MQASIEILNPERVEKIYVECQQGDGETITVEGIVHKVAFYRDQLEAHRQDIADMLDELPDEFKEGHGGGYTFLNMCLLRTGQQWTGLHLTMEKLVLLGLATERLGLVLPRDMWSALPGGMPYYVVKK